MKIRDFLESNIKLDITQIAREQELSVEIQEILFNQGLLPIPPGDNFGFISIAALKRFQNLKRCYEPEFLGNRTAQELLEFDGVASRGGKTVTSIEVKISQDTLLKAKPLQSDVLLEAEKYNLKAGLTLNVTFFEVERGHIKITLPDSPVENILTWYIFAEHVEVFEDTTKVYPRREEIKLPVPYKCQRDNAYNPDGSCNVTSIAMCLEYLKIPRKHSQGQFEDELYQYALDQGLSRHDGEHLAQIVRDYGAKDNFITTATIEQVKDWLCDGNPVVIHGYFTYPSGHIIVGVGYDSKGFIVHDPYGEWFAQGYDRNDPYGHNEKGKFLHYSYGLIKDTCIPDGHFYVHFIKR
ncbi:C39 family peptidase [Laspinema olomoucense]|uniref:C39 family peptidase n=1 Tax=Laspinema olomoucense TaxID=3231600 RepID=UPI0021BB945B|nr:C39 family peptidase [Laspinema sp. D3d]MCT7975896.1 C39 family peptidase [Laspinema sp. D3d]